MFFLCSHTFSLLSVLILFAGQTLSHFPHPAHLSFSTFAKHPLCTFIAPNGQIISQAPQATQSVLSTVAYRFDAIPVPPIIKYVLLDFSSIIRFFSAARAAASCLFQPFFYCVDNFRIRIWFDFHFSSPIIYLI